MEKKIINNAISAYFWLGALLLLPSKKQNINHPFVKKHARSALFIHICMFLTYIIFIFYKFLGSFSFYGFYGNHVVWALIFLGLFGWILYGAYKASLGDEFWIQDISKMTKTDNLISIKNSNLNEQWIFTIVVSMVPFVGFLLKGKFSNYKSPIIENNIKFNLIVTFIISLFFIYGYENIWFLLGLLYLIFIWFYGIMVIVKSNIITFELSKVPTFEEIYLYMLSAFQYVKNYFSNQKFVAFDELLQEKIKNYKETQEKNKAYIETLKQPKLNAKIAYIPYLNIISLIDIRSKNQFHIINGLLITTLSLLLILLQAEIYQLLLVFLVFFGLGYTKTLHYQFPFLFDIYEFFKMLAKKIFSSGKKAIELQKETHEIHFEVETNKTSKNETTSSLDTFK